MKKLFFILTLLFTLSSNAFSKDLKVMSWNVYFDDSSGEDRYPEIIKTIAKQNPDVVCLQEATDKFIKSLKLSHNFDGYTLTNINGPGSYKNIILTKPKISSNGIIRLPTNMNRYAPYIKTKINGKSTVVVNLHLDSMMEDTDLRIKQLEKVVNSTSASDNVILCGDLNFGDDDKENTFINKH
ncbi:MAG: endonuclease/exonuclease/phosphatase family protein, partial [Gammaproteobacteria bacterium]|nr:endonuclease/exonuclease/phosphatase family protein [Gammaproteobacteria bacterium]